MISGSVALCGRVALAQDSAPPEIVSTSSLDGRTIGVRFNEPVEPNSAANVANYHLSGGALVTKARLRSDGISVELNVSGLTGPRFTLSVLGVQDSAGNAASGSAEGVTQGLRVEDVGRPSQAGSAFSCKPGTIEVKAGGVDIWGETDSFQFAHQERTGDFDIRVRVASFGPREAHLNAKAMLMMREGLETGSPYVSVAVNPTMGVWTARRRVAKDGPTVAFNGNWRVSWPPGTTFPNSWLRLKRAANTITAYGSVDGEGWMQIGDAYTPELPFRDTIHIGLATTSHGEQGIPYSMVEVRYEQFGDFVVTNGSVAFLRHPASTVAVENRPITFAGAVQVAGTPAGNLTYQWFKNDAAIPGATGSAYTTPLLTRADNGTGYRVGVALPGSPITLSKAAALTVEPDVVPPVVTSSAAFVDGPLAARFNELVRADSASDLSHYSLDLGAAVTEAKLMADGCTVVLKAAGLKAGLHHLTVKGVRDLAGCPATETTVPVQRLEWRSQNIGTVDETGFAYPFGAAEINVQAGRGNIWTNADSFHFVQRARTGDFDVSVQASQIGRVNAYTRGGLMVRESLAPGSRNLFACTYPATGEKRWVSTVRWETGGMTTLAPGNSYVRRPPDFAYPNAWFRLKRVANTFTAYCGTNGVEWVQLGDQLTPAPPYPATVYLGLATTPNSSAPNRPTIAQYLNLTDRSEPLVSEPIGPRHRASFPPKQHSSSTPISNPSAAASRLVARPAGPGNQIP